jgi:hypothetical protein
MRKSVANARAELTARSPDEDRSLAESTWPPLTAPDKAAVRNDNQTAVIQPDPDPTNAQGWNIASRWPEPKTVASADDQSASAPEPAQPAPALTPDRLAAAAATAPPSATPVAATQPDGAAHTADTSDGGTTSIRILLSVLVCGLALAAIIGPMIFKYVRPRPRKDLRASARRRPIWDMNVSEAATRRDDPRMAAAPPQQYIDAPPEPRVLDEAVDELENLLARASRRSAA